MLHIHVICQSFSPCLLGIITLWWLWSATKTNERLCKHSYNVSHVTSNKNVNIPVIIVESIDFEIVFFRVWECVFDLNKGIITMNNAKVTIDVLHEREVTETKVKWNKQLQQTITNNHRKKKRKKTEELI
jgi:hypothetical protein